MFTAPAVHHDSNFLYDSASATYPHHAENVAAYVNGAYATTESWVRSIGHHKRVLMIDVLGTAPSKAGALDIEPGCASPATAAGWVKQRVDTTGASARLYFSQSNEPAVRHAVSQLPQKYQDKVKYWIANPGGTAHLPGAHATQYHWGDQWDISAIGPHFLGNT